MCGIAGFLERGRLGTADETETALHRMAAAIAHRGPDDSGVWYDLAAGIAFAHRRLSILDLSPAGHQPMRSASGRYVLVFNGEIYNHLRLREELRRSDVQPQWRGHSDTETLLAGFESWGIPETIRRAVGMFAFALWDSKDRTLTLARDRIGEKPLYYGWRKTTFLFGSELKSIRAHSACDGTVNRRALALLLRYNCIPAPFSIYEGIYKLAPGSILILSPDSGESKVTPYWSVAAVAASGNSNRFTGTPEEAVGELETLLKDAVRLQMLSDVPLGAFLSGGIDSSTVVALMQAQSSRPVRTFSIGFGEVGFDEAPHAKAVAGHLGTDHTELYVTPSEALNVVPRIASVYDEPFSDSSQIPTFLVAQLARRAVTVSLSGDAGDELFCGYNRYSVIHRTWSSLSRVPPSFRRFGARLLESIPQDNWNQFAWNVERSLPKSLSIRQLAHKLERSIRALSSGSADELYQNIVSHWTEPGSIVLDGAEPRTILQQDDPRLDQLGTVSRMMALDMLTYLPDDILVKVDRAAMNHSLETRIPFLDHRVIEFAWRLPLSMKIRNGESKWILRQVLARHVPREMVDRPKMGFGVPLASWLRGPLRDWAEGLLHPSRLRQEGFFNVAPILQKWEEHQTGRHNWHNHLWDILMFQSWLENESRPAASPG